MQPLRGAMRSHPGGFRAFLSSTNKAHSGLGSLSCSLNLVYVDLRYHYLHCREYVNIAQFMYTATFRH